MDEQQQDIPSLRALGNSLNRLLLEFGQDYEGNQLQLPDQQFANLYWFRYDWFTREDIKNGFKAVGGAYPEG